MTGAEFRNVRDRARVTREAVAAYVGTHMQNVYTFESGLVERPRWPVERALDWLNAYDKSSRTLKPAGQK